MAGAEPVVVERVVRAPAGAIFSYFADPDRWTRWQGVDAEIDLRPGGQFRVNVTGDGYASGWFVEVVPNRRVVFTWGWEAAACGSRTRGCPPRRESCTSRAGRATHGGWRRCPRAGTPVPTRCAPDRAPRHSRDSRDGSC